MNAPETVCTALLGESWEQNRAAVEALKQLTPEARAAVSTLLLKRMGGKKGYSFYGLVGLALAGTPKGKALVYDLATGNRGESGRCALSALGNIREDGAFQILMTAALEKPGSRAEYALEGLRTRNDKAAVPLLVEKLKTMKSVRSQSKRDYYMAAFRTLIQLAPEDSGVGDIVAGLITKPLGKESWDVDSCYREVVEKGTEAQCDAAVVIGALKTVIAAPMEARKPLAAAALGRLTGDYATWMPILLQSLLSNDPSVRTGADIALDLVGPEAHSLFDAAAKSEVNDQHQKRLATACRTLRGRLPGLEPQPSEPEDPFLVLETELDLKLPELHRRLYESGLMSLPSDWKDNWKRYWVERPPLLTNASGEVDWLSPKDMLKARFPGYWKQDIPLVQFAREGAGDLYCYRLDWAHEGGIPIVLAAHDDNEARCLAPHLEGFIFRELLLAMVDMYLDGQFTLEELIHSLRNEVNQLQGYVRQEWLDLLSSILDREPAREVVQVVNKVNYAHLISREEAKRILSKQLAFEHLDETFEHME